MGKQMIEFKYGKGLVVLDVQDIRKYIPSEIWWEGIKRGKGFKRTNESYERKGNSRRSNPQAITANGGFGMDHGETAYAQCQRCGVYFNTQVGFENHTSICYRKGEQT